MKIRHFKVEQWMNEYEEHAKYNIAETCVYSVTLEELFQLSGENPDDYWKRVLAMRLTYGHINGSPELKEGICRLYKEMKSENILTAHGAIGANHLVLNALVEKGDRVVTIVPTYQQHYSIPEAIGADLHILKLKREEDFLPNLDELRKLVDGRAKLICINNPNNPTGALMKKEMLLEIVDIARKAGAYILCDEVYRGLNQEEQYTESIADLYEKGISTSSMSKVFSLAGLRLGWIAGPKDVIEACCVHRDYNTISCSMLDESLGAMALKNAEKILKRNKGIVHRNLEILDAWVAAEPHISYVKPAAGTTALLYYDFPMDSRALCVDLMEKTGVLMTPGACFDYENCVRIGYASSEQELVEGLKIFSEYIRNR